MKLLILGCCELSRCLKVLEFTDFLQIRLVEWSKRDRIRRRWLCWYSVAQSWKYEGYRWLWLWYDLWATYSIYGLVVHLWGLGVAVEVEKVVTFIVIPDW